VKKDASKLPAADCSTIVCHKDEKEVYCPLSFDKCKDKYQDCRVIECEKELVEKPEPEKCKEEYNNCKDGDEEIICKGSFSACADAFDSCTCGTFDEEDTAQPDFDSTQDIDCNTDVYICSRTSITISGDVAESIVTCKGDFQQCSITYGYCECGNSTLTDFPTQYIGNTQYDGSAEKENGYWCDYNGKSIPCSMLPENCKKKSNTCNKGNDVWITCQGNFDFCQKKYGECLCGVERPSTGFMVTSSE